MFIFELSPRLVAITTGADGQMLRTGTNTYMMFEPNPPAKRADYIKLLPIDPEEHPNAYDASGKVVDEYKDPDMALGFAECEHSLHALLVLICTLTAKWLMQVGEISPQSAHEV